MRRFKRKQIIKIGDKLVYNKGSVRNEEAIMQGRAYIRVDTIEKCHSENQNCRKIGCPGHINGECYGYSRIGRGGDILAVKVGYANEWKGEKR